MSLKKDEESRKKAGEREEKSERGQMAGICCKEARKSGESGAEASAGKVENNCENETEASAGKAGDSHENEAGAIIGKAGDSHGNEAEAIVGKAKNSVAIKTETIGREAGNQKKQRMLKKTGWRADGKTLGKAAVCLVFVLVFGLLMEFFCNLPLIQNQEEGNFEIPLSELTFEGFELEYGAGNGAQEAGGQTSTGQASVGKGSGAQAADVENSDIRETGKALSGRESSGQAQPAPVSLRLTADTGTIHIPVNGFIGELACTYEYGGLLNLSAEADVENEYGEVRERDALKITDRNPKPVKTTWLRIGRKTHSVDLTVSRDGLYEPGLSYIDFSSMPLSFTGFKAVTAPAVNPFRLFFFWLAAGSAAFLFAARRLIGKRVEIGFLVLALTGGTLLSLSLPANKVGFDEEIHFEQSFWIANYKSPVHMSPEIFQEFSAGIDTWPLNQPGGLREQRELNSYLDETGDYRNGTILWSADLNKTTFTGYLGQAAVLKAGEILNLPFSLLFKLGRLGNLFIYCAVMALAIRKTPVGKGILAFIGLMPAPLMLAGVYSYDPAVTAFIALAFSYMAKAALEPEKELSIRDYAILLAAFFWGCRIKAVYAPLILLGFLIPAARFKSAGRRRWMRAGFAAMFLLMMASFVLPVLISPSETGDLRGGATSEAGQMAYVLGQPLAYARVLLENIFMTFPSYVLGEGAFGTLGHLGSVSFPWLFYAGSAAVILTDTRSSCGKRLTKWQRVWIILVCGACAALVWTSMYIAFTPPGNTYIEGVQGRYYLPFLFPLWLAASPSFVTVHLKNETYYPAVLALAGAVFYACYFADVLVPLCL